ncbi:MAG TPA: DoxX family protein [Burkholderiales bacterium]|nr:DoxX family protein [Burkholderiales bacterium]
MIDVRTAPHAAFVLRVALGVMFIAHALLKYYVFTLPGTVQFFQSIGLPGPIAYLTFWAELIGGMLILAGAWTRWTVAALIPVLIGATWAHAGNGWLFTAPNGGWEYPAFLTVAAVVQVLLGDGKYAVSALLTRPGLRPAVV